MTFTVLNIERKETTRGPGDALINVECSAKSLGPFFFFFTFSIFVREIRTNSLRQWLMSSIRTSVTGMTSLNLVVRFASF